MSAVQSGARRILFVGSGRLSRHLQFYFSSLGHQISVVSAREVFADPEVLSTHNLSSNQIHWDSVFLLCKDRELARAFSLLSDPRQKFFIKANAWVHCSGALVIPGVHAWHPLASFSEQLFDADFYLKVPFIGTQESLELSAILPGISNPVFRINSHQKALYHALCVMSGNISSLFWNHVADRFSKDLDLPKETMHAFVESVSQNFIHLGVQGQSGPFTRGDFETLSRNQDSLKGDRFEKVFEATCTALGLTSGRVS